jgi:hypothetical protein
MSISTDAGAAAYGPIEPGISYRWRARGSANPNGTPSGDAPTSAQPSLLYTMNRTPARAAPPSVIGGPGPDFISIALHLYGPSSAWSIIALTPISMALSVTRPAAARIFRSPERTRD